MASPSCPRCQAQHTSSLSLEEASSYPGRATPDPFPPRVHMRYAWTQRNDNLEFQIFMSSFFFFFKVKTCHAKGWQRLSHCISQTPAMTSFNHATSHCHTHHISCHSWAREGRWPHGTAATLLAVYTPEPFATGTLETPEHALTTVTCRTAETALRSAISQHNTEMP